MMFNEIKSGKTAIFIDLSNIFYTQYTLGWKFNVDKLLEALDKDQGVMKTFFYGAYSESNIKQLERVNSLQEQYGQKNNFKIFFKQIRMKGSVNKGNVDSEMTCDMMVGAERKEFDTLILFSGDGDFAHVIERLLSEYNIKVFVFSTPKHIGAELHELKNIITNRDLYNLYDINSDKDPTTRFLKQIVRGKIFLYPELSKYLNHIDNIEKQQIVDIIQSLIDGSNQQTRLINIGSELPECGFIRLKNSNGEFIYPIIKTRKIDDKKRLINYIGTL